MAAKRKSIGLEGSLARALIFLSTLTVSAAFFLPWLHYESPPILPSLIDLPESQAVPAWRLPLFAREVGHSWFVSLLVIFNDKPAEPEWSWVIYSSPLFVLLALLPSWRKVAIFSNAAVGISLTLTLFRGIPNPDLLGFEVLPGVGIWLALVGHGLMVWSLQRLSVSA